MPVVSIAAAGCVRRFNAAIRDTYDRTPTQIWNRRHILAFRPPFDRDSMLAFLSAWAVLGVEAIEETATGVAAVAS